MSLVTVAPHLAALAFIAFALLYASGRVAPRRKTLIGGAWIGPAVLSAALFAWTLAAVILEGPLGFWTEHSRNLWGNQIWFDLLLAAGVALAFLIPKAKAVGMNAVAWTVAVICTGSIGLLAMTARLLYLQERAG